MYHIIKGWYKNMQVRTSKKMTAFLKKNLKGCSVTLSHVKLNQDCFRVYVDFSLLDHISDYDYETETFSVIRVSYPAECFAMCKYLTTRDLNRIFMRSDKTAAGFIEAIKDEILI